MMSSALGLPSPALFNQFLDVLNGLAFFVSIEILRVRGAQLSSVRIWCRYS